MQNVKIMKVIISLIFLIIFTSSSLYAQCSAEIKLASAGTWANLRNSKDSLKYKTSKIIKEATQGKSKAEFIISSVPNKYLKNYGDKNYCEQKLRETTGENRLVFNSPILSSADTVNEWISGFSQGKSEQGKKLYEECDRSCSPAYEYHVSFENKQYKIKALVSCGHARDKNDNQYKVKSICKS